MPFPYFTESVQAAALSGTSNVLAQAIKSYQKDIPLALNFTPVAQFATYSLLNTPLNCAWQEWLESNFPGTSPAPPPPTSSDHHKDGKTEKRPAQGGGEGGGGGGINITNTLIKFLLDQTIGAAFNTILFIVGIGLLQGAKLWPAVSLLSFTLVPVEKRVLVGCVVGVLWGIILSLKVG